jgi:hypothetical protein
LVSPILVMTWDELFLTVTCTEKPAGNTGIFNWTRTQMCKVSDP